jgi:hypothetical protein
VVSVSPHSSLNNGMVWYGTAWHGTARHGTTRHGTTRYGTVRHGTVRYGMGVNNGVRISKADHIFLLLLAPLLILIMLFTYHSTCYLFDASDDNLQGLLDIMHTNKKENQILLIYKEIQSGAVAKSYMRKGFLIYEEFANISPYMRRPLVIYDFATSPF